MASAFSSSAISISLLLISGLAIEVPKRYSPSYTALALNIGETYSETNSSFKSSIKTFEAPISLALDSTSFELCSCPMSAVKAITSAEYCSLSQCRITEVSKPPE